MVTRYEQILLDFAKYIKLPSPETLLDTEELLIGPRTIGFSFEPHLIDDPASGDMLIFSVLGAPPAGKEGAIHQLMLEANNLWCGTGGATLGLRHETGAAILALRLPLERLHASLLADTLKTFIDTAGFWAAVINGDHDIRATSDISQRV